MKKLGFMFLLVFAIVSLIAAQTGGPHYHQVAKYALDGDGFWDYITYDPNAHRLFIAHSDKIDVVDATTGKQTGSIPAAGAHGVALVPDKHLGFISNGRAGTIRVFDTQTLQPGAEIKAGENPDAIIYDPHSRHVIVMNGRSKDLMAIDPASQKVVATVPLGGKLEFAATDAGHIYVNVEDTGEIAAVDTKSWKPDKRWKLPGCEEPRGLAIDESKNHLFSVCGNKQMLVVDTKSGAIVAAVPTGGGTDAAAFDAGTNLAFASNGEGTLTVVKQGAEGKYQVAENVPTQRGARTMALDPDSHKVFLVTAEYGPPAEGRGRPSVKPGTFTLLVYAPQ